MLSERVNHCIVLKMSKPANLVASQDAMRCEKGAMWSHRRVLTCTHVLVIYDLAMTIFLHCCSTERRYQKE